MSSEIGKYANRRDVKTLRYIFLDSLDVDPTFEAYQEDFDYCCKTTDLLEAHQNLTPFRNLPSEWNESYWAQLKTELRKNFSRERFDHMRRVALVLFADKVERMREEREAAKRVSNSGETPSPVPPDKSGGMEKEPSQPAPEPGQDTRSIEAEVAAHNESVRKERRRREEDYQRNAEKIRKLRELRIQSEQLEDGGDASLKKAVGIALAVLLALIALICLLRLWLGSPH